MAEDVVSQTVEAEAKELDKLKRKMNRIRETNSKITSEIEGMGQALDLSIPRLEHFMVALVDLGVITEKQLIEEAVRWELNLKEQLVPIVRKMREYLVEQREAMIRAQAKANRVSIDLSKLEGQSDEEAQPPGSTKD